MMSAAVMVAAAAVIPTGMAFPMIVAMVIALNVRVIQKLTADQGFHSRIRTAGNAAEQLYTGCCQRHLGTTADAAADQHIRFQRRQYASQSAVTAAVGIHNLCRQNLTILNIIDLELLGMTKVLKDISVFVSNRDSHNIISFRQ